MKKKDLLFTMILVLVVNACAPAQTTTSTDKSELFIPEDIPGEVIYIPFPCRDHPGW